MAQKFLTIDLATGKRVLKNLEATLVSFDASGTGTAGINQNTVQEALKAEILRAFAKENALNSAIEAEVSRAEGAEAALQALFGEIGDTTVKAELDKITSAATALTQKVDGHIGNAEIHVTSGDKSKWNAYDAAIKSKVDTATFDEYKRTNNEAVEELKQAVANKNSNTMVYETEEEFKQAATSLNPKNGDLVFVVENKKAYIYKGVAVAAMAAEIPEGWVLFDDISTEVDLAGYLKTETAESTYAKKSDISDMLTKTEAGTTYLTQATAQSDYLTKTEAGSTYRKTATKLTFDDFDSGLQTKINNKAENSAVTALESRVEKLEGDNAFAMDIELEGGAAGELVAINGSTGKFEKATLASDNVAGILIAPTKLVIGGKITYAEGGLTPGKVYFLGDNSKPSLTCPQAKGNHIVKLGRALTANTLILNIEDAIEVL